MLSRQQATRDGSRRRGNRFDRSYTAVAELELPPAVFKTCPWQPREIVELVCGSGCAAARRHWRTNM